MLSIQALRHRLEGSLDRRSWFRLSSLLPLLLLLHSCTTPSTNTTSTTSPTASPASPVATTSPAENKATGLLATIQSRGKLICGTSGKVPGFSFVNPQGEYVGFDVDICRAIRCHFQRSNQSGVSQSQHRSTVYLLYRSF